MVTECKLSLLMSLENVVKGNSYVLSCYRALEGNVLNEVLINEIFYLSYLKINHTNTALLAFFVLSLIKANQKKKHVTNIHYI